MKKILSIGNESGILQYFADALGQEGYRLFTTTDIDESVNILETEDISLLLIDFCESVERGFYVYKTARRQKKISSLSVTAFPELFCIDSEQMRNIWISEFIDGTTDILYRPFGVDLLKEKVEALIGPAD